MPNSRRQQIVDAVKTRFEGITIANGYETDIGARVFLWRDTVQSPPQDNEPEFLNIFDGAHPEGCESEVETLAITRHRHRLAIEIHLWTAAATVDSTIRKMIADLHKAIGVDPKWGGLAFNTEPVKDVIGVEHQGRKVAGAVFKFIIIYNTNAWSPYS